MANILIIDDDEKLCKVLKSAIVKMGHRVICASGVLEGLEKAATDSFDLVFLDVCLPDGNGLDIIKKIRMLPSNPEVIIITGYADPYGVEIAINGDVWDYLQKPLLINYMKLQLNQALQYHNEKRLNKDSIVIKREGIIGESPQIKDCLKFASQAALSDANVLITGETGTGKERFAKTIHNNSYRIKGNFVIVDCAALPETLVESILFGHVKGAFTGADRDIEGLIMQANGGTLFLDEVGELPMPVQKAFLRVLQEHTFRPIGGKTELTSNFRLIAATNRDLSLMAEKGLFREDLLFRLKSLLIHLPGLKERVQDIKELAMYSQLQICEREGLAVKSFSSQFINTLEAYSWPGNVRELNNALEWAISKARYESTLFPKHLPEHIRIDVVRSSLRDSYINDDATVNCDIKIGCRSLPKYRKFRETVIVENEKNYLRELIVLTKGNINSACSISGLGRPRLYELMKNHGISKSYSDCVNIN